MFSGILKKYENNLPSIKYLRMHKNNVCTAIQQALANTLTIIYAPTIARQNANTGISSKKYLNEIQTNDPEIAVPTASQITKTTTVNMSTAMVRRTCLVTNWVASNALSLNAVPWMAHRTYALRLDGFNLSIKKNRTRVRSGCDFPFV